MEGDPWRWKGGSDIVEGGSRRRDEGESADVKEWRWQMIGEKKCSYMLAAVEMDNGRLPPSGRWRDGRMAPSCNSSYP